jgi:hypothetical protein
LSFPLFRHKGGVHAKLALFRAVCLSRLLYGCETWVLSCQVQRTLRTFQQHCLRRILHMHPNVVDGALRYPSSDAVLAAAKMPSLVEMVQRAQLKWFGHCLRQQPEAALCRVLCSRLDGSSFRGYKSVLSWPCSMDSLLAEMHLQRTDAADRGRWRHAIDQLFPLLRHRPFNSSGGALPGAVAHLLGRKGVSVETTPTGDPA